MLSGHTLAVDPAPQCSYRAHIIEVTRDTPATKVFEIIVDDEVQGSGGWTVYRSERISSLYGGG